MNRIIKLNTRDDVDKIMENIKTLVNGINCYGLKCSECPFSEKKFSLNLDLPEKIADILRFVADDYDLTACELSHDDKGKGYNWKIAARILNNAAEELDEYFKKVHSEESV
jgi:hypothetical protein